jgi:methionyl-tRNA formyltransferase
MGTPEFAVASLEALIRHNFQVVAVITSPDKPAGRGQLMTQSAVKRSAIQHQIPVLQPTNLKDSDFISELKKIKADLQIVVAFRMLPELVWNMPAAGTYNLHASLLPNYRGAAPINWAIINGENETGVTTFKLQHAIDTGNILFQEKVPIGKTTTAGELHDAMMLVGAELVTKTVTAVQKSLEGQTLNFIKQNDALATHAPKLFKETCKIDWNTPGNKINNLVRGLSPYPTAHTFIKNADTTLLVKLFVVEFEMLAHTYASGLIKTDNKTFLNVYCKDGILQIKDLQLEGKRRMSVVEFLKGFQIKEGAFFV